MGYIYGWLNPSCVYGIQGSCPPLLDDFYDNTRAQDRAKGAYKERERVLHW